MDGLRISRTRISLPFLKICSIVGITQNLAVRIILSRSKIPLASGRASSSSRLSWVLRGACLISLPSLMGPECASLVGTQVEKTLTSEKFRSWTNPKKLTKESSISPPQIKAGGDLQLGVFFFEV